MIDITPAFDNVEYYRMYVFVRTDMATMTRGRIAAQVNHAGTGIAKYINDWGTPYNKAKYAVWQGEQGFGTTIVLDAGQYKDFFEIDENVFTWIHECTAGDFKHSSVPFVVRDTSYAVQDGDITHYVDVETCMAVFCAVEDYNTYLKPMFRLL